MKVFKRSLMVAAITLAFAFNTRAEWKFISMLRGEPTSSESVARVAFVGSATVRQIDGQGEAMRLCGIDSWSRLTPGDHIQPGDIVRTGRSALVVKLEESGCFVRLSPNSVMRMVPAGGRVEQKALAMSH